MEVYLDNSATTRPFDEVCARMDEINRTIYGNPSSLHRLGMEAERIARAARSAFLSSLRGAVGSAVFTSGGTEANNIAILGSTLHKCRRAPRVITTRIEHPAVTEPVLYLKQQGADVEFLDVDARGRIDLAQLRDLLAGNTALVSIMLVNNEVGTIQPVEQAAALVRRLAPGCLFHVDAVQGYGKVPVNVRDIDLLTVSGHKINGPKGSGALYVRRGVHLNPIVFGGHQETGLRSGTENVAAIGGFHVALEKTVREYQEHTVELSAMRRRLCDGIAGIPNVLFNGILEGDAAPHIVNASFPGVRSEVLLHALEARGVYVSTGSACSSNKPSLSPTLSAMGLNRERIDSAVRFSLGYGNTAEQMDYAAACVREEVGKLRI